MVGKITYGGPLNHRVEAMVDGGTDAVLHVLACGLAGVDPLSTDKAPKGRRSEALRLLIQAGASQLTIGVGRRERRVDLVAAQRLRQVTSDVDE